MFDITSLIREKIFRLPKIHANNAAGEELTEKQTTKLGYFLLYCMFGAILMSAQWTLSIIKEIPDRPIAIPNCVQNIIGILESGNNYSFYENDNYYSNYNGYNSCTLVAENPKYDFTTLYIPLKVVAKQISNYGEQIRTLENEKSRLSYQKNTAQDDYNTALIEKIANEQNRAYNTNDTRSTIENSRTRISEIESSIINLKASIESLRSAHTNEIVLLKQTLDSANTEYRNAYLLYRLYVALLSLLFAVVVFMVLYRIYVRQKIINSPHTIIFSVATFAYGLVLLQIACLFLWDIIPHKIFELILNILMVFTPLLYLVQFLWPVLIIVVFGFLVFRIQKRLYSPENILKRFISDKKCPSCGNGVDFTKPFCPLCSHEIQIDCPHCHELTLKGMPYCSNCGGKITESNTIQHTQAFDKDLSAILAGIDITEFSSVLFIPTDGASFSMKRASIIQVAVYLTQKLGKTKFAPQELHPYIHEISKHIESTIPKNEITRIIGRIHSWSETGGTVELVKKISK